MTLGPAPIQYSERGLVMAEIAYDVGSDCYWLYLHGVDGGREFRLPEELTGALSRFLVPLSSGLP